MGRLHQSLSFGYQNLKVSVGLGLGIFVSLTESVVRGKRKQKVGEALLGLARSNSTREESAVPLVGWFKCR
jgi:hypothetical protein